jgi:hypothetical protein
MELEVHEMELEVSMYVADDEGGRAGKVRYVNPGGSVDIEWLDNGEYEVNVSRERLALAVARPDDRAVLAAAGWRAEWTLRPPVSTMHPKLRGSTAQEKGKTEITLRRSLHYSEPEDGFGEATLHGRWLEERAGADPADFAELQNNVDSSADSRAQMLERRLTQQMQAMESKMQEQQERLEEKMERQAEESNKRLDRLITLVSVMQAQKVQAD